MLDLYRCNIQFQNLGFRTGTANARYAFGCIRDAPDDRCGDRTAQQRTASLCIAQVSVHTPKRRRWRYAGCWPRPPKRLDTCRSSSDSSRPPPPRPPKHSNLASPSRTLCVGPSRPVLAVQQAKWRTGRQSVQSLRPVVYGMPRSQAPSAAASAPLVHPPLSQSAYTTMPKIA